MTSGEGSGPKMHPLALLPPDRPPLREENEEFVLFPPTNDNSSPRGKTENSISGRTPSKTRGDSKSPVEVEYVDEQQDMINVFLPTIKVNG